MKQLVQLDRLLRPILWPPPADEESSVAFEFSERGRRRGWEAVLSERAALVVGSANSGKTSEFQLLCRALRQRGEFAFFITLRSLAAADVPLFTSAEDSEAFTRWLASEKRAHFFLDSVDEASLRDADGAVTAVRRIKAKLGDAARRAAWVISTRPEFWNSEHVLARLTAEFDVVLPTVSERSEDTGSGSTEFRKDASVALGEPEIPPPLATFELVPLEEWQAHRLLREGLDVANPAGLASDARRLGLGFAFRRPGDVVWLSQLWGLPEPPKSLLDALNKAKSALLKEADGSARLQDSRLLLCRAEKDLARLAAASLLCAKPNLSIPQVSAFGAPSDLNADMILQNMPLQEKRHLLSMPIFDGGGGTSVKLQPERIAQLLAAEWFRPFVAEDPNDIFEVLTVSTPDGRVVIPPLAPVAGWLATWNRQFRRRLLSIAPEVVALFGDLTEAAMSTEEVRRTLDGLLAHVASGRQPSSQFRFEADDYRQLGLLVSAAHFRSCLRRYRDNPAALRVVLRVIESAERTELAQDLLSLFRRQWPTGVSLSDTVDALGVVAGTAERTSLADAVRSPEGRNVPTYVFRALVDATYPSRLNPNELVEICFSQGRWSANDLTLDFMLRDLASSHLTNALDLALALADAIERRRMESDDEHQQRLAVRSVGRVLEVCLERVQPAELSFAQVTTVIEKVLQWSLSKSSESRSMDMDDLRPLISKRPELREAVFDVCLEQVPANRVWILRRPVANGSPVLVEPSDVDRLRTLAARDGWRGQASAKALVDDFTERAISTEATSEHQNRPPSRDFSQAKAQLAQRAESLRTGQDLAAIAWLGQWLATADSQLRRRDDEAAWRHLAVEFGAEIAEAAMTGFSAMWRRMDPQRDDDESRTYYTTIAALQALAREMAQESGVVNLSEEEARRAARYGLLEINGFPSWFWSLAQAHPSAVAGVLIEELTSVQRSAGRVAKDIAHQIEDAPDAVRAQVAPALWEWVKHAGTATSSVILRVIGHGLKATILTTAEAAREAKNRVLNSKELKNAQRLSECSGGWATAWFMHDARTLLSWCRASRNKAAAPLVLGALGRVLESDSKQAEKLSGLSPDFLVDLYRLLCEHFPPPRVEDEEPSCASVVTEVNDAWRISRFRDSLPHRIAAGNGAKSFKAMTRLIESEKDPLAKGFFVHLRRVMAERNAQPSPWAEDEVLGFETTRMGPISTDNDLFRVTARHCRATAAYFKDGEFSARPLFLAFGTSAAAVRNFHEGDFQVWLAAELQHRAQHRYSVHREPQRASGTRVDLSTASGSFRVAIEAKVVDNWSVDELRAGLTEQLSGEYLRHKACRHGLYVLLRLRKQKWRAPRLGLVAFQDVVKELEELAQQMSRDSVDGGEIEVVALDCLAGESRSPHSRRGRAWAPGARAARGGARSAHRR